ncbi:phosphoribosylamine--glycine ligase [Methanoplanus endosymbiosus]|uniref:Phosphoribosylamine--glycine ligase n=1 Tax=Methanoplanus endosymbiosus TaxID=33865 RepID=A0A9E7PNU8_9EURY|nr:phosphoribosylamine--glycine ligase [Methanoplanus endosymbiosus]UUX92336.1 phosphoribosylamine--glycine ligase [Methanoplanus endosymbiosus]
MAMKILVVGGGGREHAIAEALSRNGNCELYAVMGKKNPGIAKLCKKYLINSETDINAAAEFAYNNSIEYAVIGPEAPLEAGISDLLEEKGIACIGPSRMAARLETDKAFCRNMMEKHGVAGCPLYRVFHDAEEAALFIRSYDGDLAVKPIGLTGGKGVKIMGEHFDAEGAIEYITEIGGDVVLEERLIGEEFTLMAFVDGTHIVPMPLVQDHKRAFAGDVGPNTGGMGSYTMPDHMMPFVTEEDYDKALAIMEDVVASLRSEDVIYRGMLYGQFMNTSEGPKVIEFNARFGDPEAMNLLTLLSSDLCDIVRKIAEGRLSQSDVMFENKATVCKYLVPEGYPDSPNPGDLITIKDAGEAFSYYANVTEEDNNLYTQTSRTLAFVGMADTLTEAEKIAEEAAASVEGNIRYRTDIGTQEVLDKRIAHMKEIRQ